jgi:hypothetical protein
MCLKTSPAGASVIDVLDHVLDKGVVIDAWVQVALVRVSYSLNPGVKPFHRESAYVRNRACRVLQYRRSPYALS